MSDKKKNSRKQRCSELTVVFTVETAPVPLLERVLAEAIVRDLGQCAPLAQAIS